MRCFQVAYLLEGVFRCNLARRTARSASTSSGLTEPASLPPLPFASSFAATGARPHASRPSLIPLKRLSPACRPLRTRAAPCLRTCAAALLQPSPRPRARSLRLPSRTRTCALSCRPPFEAPTTTTVSTRTRISNPRCCASLKRPQSLLPMLKWRMTNTPSGK